MPALTTATAPTCARRTVTTPTQRQDQCLCWWQSTPAVITPRNGSVAVIPLWRRRAAPHVLVKTTPSAAHGRRGIRIHALVTALRRLRANQTSFHNVPKTTQYGGHSTLMTLIPALAP